MIAIDQRPGHQNLMISHHQAKTGTKSLQLKEVDFLKAMTNQGLELIEKKNLPIAVAPNLKAPELVSVSLMTKTKVEAGSMANL